MLKYALFNQAWNCFGVNGMKLFCSKWFMELLQIEIIEFYCDWI